MLPNGISPSCGLLLFALFALVSAQDTPSASSPPFPLDSNGEAHFNIPVVIKLADLSNGAPAASVAVVEARDLGDDVAFTNDVDGQDDEAEDSAKVLLVPPAHIEPVFDVAHQGTEDDDNNAGDLKARNMMAGGDAAAAAAAMDTHTVVLVETTGTAVSTLTEPCTNETAPGHPTTSPAAPAAADANTNTTDLTPAAPVACETGKLPLPLNHTSFPLRNGTNSSLPCNSTGWAKPTAAGTGLNAGGTGAPYNNPANMAGAGGNNNGTKGFMGAAGAVGVSWSIAGVAVVAGIVAVAAI